MCDASLSLSLSPPLFSTNSIPLRVVIRMTSLFVHFLPDLVPVAILLFIWFPPAYCCCHRSGGGKRDSSGGGGSSSSSRSSSQYNRSGGPGIVNRPPFAGLEQQRRSRFVSSSSFCNSSQASKSTENVLLARSKSNSAALGRIELPTSIGADTSWRQKGATFSGQKSIGMYSMYKERHLRSASSPCAPGLSWMPDVSTPESTPEPGKEAV